MHDITLFIQYCARVFHPVLRTCRPSYTPCVHPARTAPRQADTPVHAPVSYFLIAHTSSTPLETEGSVAAATAALATACADTRNERSKLGGTTQLCTDTGSSLHEYTR